MRVWVRRGWVGIAALVAACAGSARQYDPPPQAVSCDQANAAAYQAVRAMGYVPTTIELATPTQSGMVRVSTPPGQRARALHVRVTCTAATATLVADEDGTWFGGVDIKRGFYLALPSALADVTAEPRASALPPRRRGAGLQVLLEPVPGPGTTLDFGWEVTTVGLLPVRVTVTNDTPRTYTIAAADVVLVRADETRASPLPEAEVLQRVTTATTMGASVVSGSIGAARVASARFDDGDVPPGSVRSGWLFFPSGAYARGRATVQDRDADEAEGVVVEFH